MRAVVERLEHQDCVGLTIAAQTGQVRKGTVGSEDVVAVVAANLQTTSRYDEPLTRERGRNRGSALCGIRRGLGLGGSGGGSWRPVGGHEGAELVGGGSATVLCFVLFFAHPHIVPRCHSV